MIRKIIFAFLIVLLPFLVVAQDMDWANDAYSRGDYDTALEHYTALVDSGFESTALFFNTGNTYYKMGDLPNSLLFYERAALLSPKDEDIQFNLELSRRMVVDKIELVDQIFIKKWFVNFRSTFHTDAWAWMSISLFLVFVVGLFVYAFLNSSGGRKAGFYLALTALFFSVVSGVFSYQQKKLLTDRNGAIIFSPSVTVKSSPDDRGNDLFILHEGSKVTVRDSVDGWWEIKMGDGNVGWIPKNSLKKI